jgi:hypothetical protein
MRGPLQFVLHWSWSMSPGRLVASFLSVVILLTISPAARADEPAYLRSMPTTEQVMQKIRSDDAFDTAARRYAAFDRLTSLMGIMHGAKDIAVSPGEEQLASAYRNAGTAVRNSLLANVPQSRLGETNAKFTIAWTKYQFDRAFHDQLVDTFFSPEFKATLQTQAIARQGELEREQETRVKKEAKEKRESKAAQTWAELMTLAPEKWRWLLNRDMWLIILGVSFGLGFLHSLAPLRFHQGSPLRFSVGGKQYRIGHVTGVVRDIQHWTNQTVVPTSRSYTNYDGSTHTEHGSYVVASNRQQIMLEMPSGRAWDLQFTGNFAAAPGQRVTAIWAMRGRKKSGPYILYRNHELGRAEYPHALDHALRPTRKPMLLLPFLLLAVGIWWPWILVALVAYWFVMMVALRLFWVARFRSKNVWAMVEAPASR